MKATLPYASNKNTKIFLPRKVHGLAIYNDGKSGEISFYAGDDSNPLRFEGATIPPGDMFYEDRLDPFDQVLVESNGAPFRMYTLEEV